MREILHTLKEHLQEIIFKKWKVELELIRLEIPPSREHGEIACTVAFDLAGKLKTSPRNIAGEILRELHAIDEIERAEIAGAGYLNFYLKRSLVAELLINDGFRPQLRDEVRRRLIIEHTSINPNKTPHVGHLRNSVLGDTLANLARILGHDSVVQNYIDNTGVQVADVVVGLTEMRGMDMQQIKAVGNRLDRFCWDVYADVAGWYEADPSRNLLRSETMHALEKNEGSVAEVGEYVASTILKAHLALMHRIGIEYDVAVWERDVLFYKFWDQALGILKKKNLVYLAEEGDRQGCWVMSLEKSEDFAEMDDPDKILVRSNGTITYTGKDIAYHFWKCGLLDVNFRFAKFYEYNGESMVWTTTPDTSGEEVDVFNDAEMAINVIDVRQAYPQKVVRAAIRGVDENKELRHFAYEMVALSPECAEELGMQLGGEDRSKKYVEMSGRKGLGVKADELIDLLKVKALERIKENNPDLEETTAEETAEKITIGALRYFLLKFSKNKVIAFDFNDALSFEGDTGPYIQYSLVRAKSIKRKLVEADLIQDARSNPQWSFDDIKDPDEMKRTWDIVFSLYRYLLVLPQAFNVLDLSVIAGWANEVAQKFNNYYHQYSILKESNESLRNARLGVVSIFIDILEGVCAVMGLPVPDKM